jgi:SAM-dependent methyltransferase
MMNLLTKYIIKGGVYSHDYALKFLDVGSMDVVGNGSYKNMFTFDGIQKNWTYTGLDIASGNNVDIVSPDPYNWPIKDESYDIVISGQCAEHVEAPWIWVKEIERVCKADGYIFIIAPFKIAVHRFPVDCYRYVPDGFAYLFGKHCNFEVLETEVSNDMDTYIVAKKRHNNTKGKRRNK